MTVDDKIAEAETALHKLQTGSLREEIDYAGRRTRFTKADIGKLTEYLAALRAEKSSAPRRGAIGIGF